MNKFSSLVAIDKTIIKLAAQSCIDSIKKTRNEAKERAIQKQMQPSSFLGFKTLGWSRPQAENYIENCSIFDGDDDVIKYKLYAYGDLERAQNLLSAANLSVDNFVYCSTEDANFIERELI